MDAKVGDWVVTPRIGKPVEIQALWYNALRVMQDLAPMADPRYRGAGGSRAARVSCALFWNEAAGCLYDVVDGDRARRVIRPNQIFALSLPHRCWREQKARSVLEVVERDLLTPFGLRSLAPRIRSIAGAIEGDPRAPRQRPTTRARSGRG